MTTMIAQFSFFSAARQSYEQNITWSMLIHRTGHRMLILLVSEETVIEGCSGDWGVGRPSIGRCLLLQYSIFPIFSTNKPY